MREILPRVCAALVAASALVAALWPSPARGAASVTADLGQGGFVRGDVSRSGRETDTVTVNLARGSAIIVKWSAAFDAAWTFLGPDDRPVPLGIEASPSGKLKAWVVPETGTYRFTVESRDASQGVYSLSVQAFWPRVVVVTGTGETTADVPMPAFSAVKGKVDAQPGSSHPAILSFTSPLGEELLVRPVAGSPARVKSPTIKCRDAGVYRLTCSAQQGTQEFRAVFLRTTRKLPRRNLDVANGVDPPSYDEDGIDSYFRRRCEDCHGWAGSYEGVRSKARAALERMRSGSMPRGGPRATTQETALVAKWIAKGFGK